jgi:uncharacterized protein
MPGKCSIVEEIYAALAARDLAAIFARFAPDVEICESERLPWGGRYRGAGGLATFLSRLTNEIESEIVTERLVDLGDHVVQVGRTRGRVLATGKEFDLPEVHVWRFRERKITGFTCYLDPAEMLQALG